MAKHSGDEGAERWRGRTSTAKVASGERGPVWWDDGAPDETRHKVANSSYSGWWESLGGTEGDDPSSGKHA